MGGLGLLPRCKTIMNFSKQTLVRKTRFSDHVPLWRKNFQFSAFDAIEINERISGDIDNCFIGLRPLSDPRLWIKYFENTSDGRKLTSRRICKPTG
jgi:hypothetical protein